MNVTSVLKETLPWKNTKNPGADSVGQWAKALATKIYNLSLVSGPLMVEGEKNNFFELSS